MNKALAYFLIGLISFSLLGTSEAPALSTKDSLRPDSDQFYQIEGEVLRFYEERGADWASYVLIKDSFGDEYKIYVHPTLTLVRRKGQILELQEITGGMKATVIYQKPFGDLRAMSINVSGIFYG